MLNPNDLILLYKGYMRLTNRPNRIDIWIYSITLILIRTTRVEEYTSL